jgi:hypothetical protein
LPPIRWLGRSVLVCAWVNFYFGYVMAGNDTTSNAIVASAGPVVFSIAWVILEIKRVACIDSSAGNSDIYKPINN